MHEGACTDVLKTIEYYEQLNAISFNFEPEKYLNRLVYCEGLRTESAAIDKLKKIVSMKIKEKIEFIKSANPEFINIAGEPGFLTFINECISR